MAAARMWGAVPEHAAPAGEIAYKSGSVQGLVSPKTSPGQELLLNCSLPLISSLHSVVSEGFANMNEGCFTA